MDEDTYKNRIKFYTSIIENALDDRLNIDPQKLIKIVGPKFINEDLSYKLCEAMIDKYFYNLTLYSNCDRLAKILTEDQWLKLIEKHGKSVAQYIPYDMITREVFKPFLVNEEASKEEQEYEYYSTLIYKIYIESRKDDDSVSVCLINLKDLLEKFIDNRGKNGILYSMKDEDKNLIADIVLNVINYYTKMNYRVSYIRDKICAIIYQDTHCSYTTTRLLKLYFRLPIDDDTDTIFMQRFFDIMPKHVIDNYIKDIILKYGTEDTKIEY